MPVTFAGAVAPDHAGNRVLLQEQAGALGSTWKTLERGRLGSGSQFSIDYRFKLPGDHTLRVLFPGDARNIAAASDSVVVRVQQKEVPGFTIITSKPIITEGDSATIFGIFSIPGSTTPDPNAQLTLYGRTDGQHYATITHVTTGADGSYSFTVSPTQNEAYQVRTSFAPFRDSAELFEGVQDVVTLNPVAPTSTVGQSVTFTGGVTPDKAGHVIELQRLGADGHFHTVEYRYVTARSSYHFVWTFGTPGTKTFRVHITGGPENVGADSPTATVTVSLPAVTSLPPASQADCRGRLRARAPAALQPAGAGRV